MSGLLLPAKSEASSSPLVSRSVEGSVAGNGDTSAVGQLSSTMENYSGVRKRFNNLNGHS